MDRKKFIQQTVQGTTGLLMLPLFFSACRKKNLFDDTNFDGKVLIVGAGAAGLYAGYLLKSRGIDFQILEASDRYGGRLGKLEEFADFPLDLGAQWLHGRNSILGDLAKKSGTTFALDDSDIFFWFKNEMRTSLPKDVQSIFEKENLPDVSYEEYAIQQGLGEDYKFIVENMAGDQGADASLLSAYWNVKEEENWTSGENDFKFEKTFFDLINEQVASSVQDEIVLNVVVDHIDYSTDTVVISDSNGNTYEGNKAIITVPITILQDEDISFNPALSADKLKAFKKIGMGAGMKVFLKFSSRFYHENIIGGSVCAAYADETVGKTGDDHVLLAFIMGEQAEFLTSLGSDEAIANALLEELDEMYDGKASSSFLEAFVQNWTTEPFVRGAYSYSTVGIGNSRSVAAEPVADKLFFAGEAMNLNGHHQTVHGAVETGYREVINILNAAKK